MTVNYKEINNMVQTEDLFTQILQVKKYFKEQHNLKIDVITCERNPIYSVIYINGKLMRKIKFRDIAFLNYKQDVIDRIVYYIAFGENK